MKMAKASGRDITMAMTLATALESLDRGLMPGGAQVAEDEDSEDFDSLDDEQCGRALRHVLEVLRDGSIGRVVWGMAVLLDPEKKVVDPSANTLDDHPDTVAANLDAERYRWLRNRMDGDNWERVHDDSGRHLLGGAALDAAVDSVLHNV